MFKSADTVYKKNQIKILNAAAEEKRRQIALKKKQEEIAAGTYQAPGDEDNQDSWGRGSKMSEAKANRAADEARFAERQNRPARQAPPEDNNFGRADFSRRTGGPPRDGGDRQDDKSGFAKGGPPTFSRGGDRGDRGAAANDDDKGGFSKGGPPTFSRGGNAPRRNQDDGGDGGAGLGFRSNNVRGNRGRGGGDRGGSRGGFGGGDRPPRRNDDNRGGDGGGFGNFRSNNQARK